jgi:hypothetical protein
VAETATKREPFQKILSENVIVLYGWKDAHAVVRVRLPIPLKPWYSVEIPADAILKFKSNFEEAYTYGQRPAAERIMEKPLEFEARHDCRGRWGYPDGHVALGVWRLIWFWLDFPFDEFVLAKKAMDEAYMWAQMPEDVRKLQGAES